MKPRETIATGAPDKTCAGCNLASPDDGRRWRRHGGKVFLCASCRPGGMR